MAYNGVFESKYEIFRELLYRRQRFQEPFEEFAWEILRKYRSLDPNVSQAGIIRKIVSSCLPVMSAALQGFQFQDVNELVEFAKEVTMALHMY